MWESYFASLGLPTTNLANATETAITPMPSNRPRCSIADARLTCGPAPTPSCVLSADQVQLFNWPEVTSMPASSNSNDIAPVTAVINNMTFTSPFVYFHFNSLQALTSTDLDQPCSMKSPLGATGTFAAPWGGAISPNGGPVTNAISSLAPESLSSLIRDLGSGVNTASVVSEIAHGGPNYAQWINYIAGSRYIYLSDDEDPLLIDFGGVFFTNVLAQPIDYRNFKFPDPTAYYLNINTAAGCNRVGPHPECNTIFDGAYRAQLVVPGQVRSLRPEWAFCSAPLYGAVDSPQALTAEGSVAGVAVPGGRSFTTSPTSPDGRTGHSSAPARTSHVIPSPTQTSTAGSSGSLDSGSADSIGSGNGNPGSDNSGSGSSGDGSSSSSSNDGPGQGGNPDDSGSSSSNSGSGGDNSQISGGNADTNEGGDNGSSDSGVNGGQSDNGGSPNGGDVSINGSSNNGGSSSSSADGNTSGNTIGGGVMGSSDGESPPLKNGPGVGGSIAQTTATIVHVGEPASGVFSVPGTTIEVGGSAVVIDNLTISAAAGGLVIDGSTTVPITASGVASLAIVETETVVVNPTGSTAGVQGQTGAQFSPTGLTSAGVLLTRPVAWSTVFEAVLMNMLLT